MQNSKYDIGLGQGLPAQQVQQMRTNIAGHDSDRAIERCQPNGFGIGILRQKFGFVLQLPHAILVHTDEHRLILAAIKGFDDVHG